MLGVAGILGQEFLRPDVFWYEAATKVDLPFNIQGLVAFQLITMHWVESKRGYDWRNPGSQDQDPIFSSFSLPKHEVGYPGGIFAPFVPGDLAELKVKELKNGRLVRFEMGDGAVARFWVGERDGCRQLVRCDACSTRAS
jgi:light-harvesting complex I chlorophyll a/b binding protein 4